MANTIAHANETRPVAHSALRSLLANQIAGVFGILIAMIIISHFLSPTFLTGYNITIIMRALAFAGIVALGQCLLLILGELDLSIGAIAGLCAVVGGMLMVQAKLDPFVAFGICLMLGVLCGFINGILIAGLRLNALVATIGMTGIYAGINLVATKGADHRHPSVHPFLGKGDIAGIPIPFIFLIVVAIIITVLALCTPFGRYIYAIGNNREAAQMLGIKVNKVRVICFMIAGLLASLAGMLMVARLGSPAFDWECLGDGFHRRSGHWRCGDYRRSGQPIGRAHRCGHYWSYRKCRFVLLGVSPYWQTIVSGAIVVLAISFDSIHRNFMKKGS